MALFTRATNKVANIYCCIVYSQCFLRWVPMCMDLRSVRGVSS